MAAPTEIRTNPLAEAAEQAVGELGGDSAERPGIAGAIPTIVPHPPSAAPLTDPAPDAAEAAGEDGPGTGSEAFCTGSASLPPPEAPVTTPVVHYAAAGAASALTASAAVPTFALPSRRDALGRLWRYVRLAAKAATAIVLALTLLVLGLVVTYRWVDPPASTLMLAQRLDGVDIQQTWVPLRQISPALIRAVVVSEDGGFCRHRGVDWTALVDALESSRGGSTITMQLVKNLFLWPSRSYVRKAIEIMLAYLVEALWSKERILEVYLNVAEWGEGIFGAEAAARHHFGISASRLTAAEAALLAVSLPNPIVREAGAPGPGARRMAANLQIRMRAAPAATSCVLVRRPGF